MIRTAAEPAGTGHAEQRPEDPAGIGERPDYQIRLERALADPEVASELFLPPELILWKRRTTRLKRGGASAARSAISGVRFQGRDPGGEDPSPVAQCQRDLVRLVRSLRRIRSEEGLQATILSRRPLRCRVGPHGEVTRAKFGFSVREPDWRVRKGLETEARPADRWATSDCGERSDDREAAAACHRRIVRTARRAGLVVESPRHFDAATGMAGLEAWAGEVVLRRRARPSPWWLATLLLLVLPFLRWGCEDQPSFFGVPIDTSSFVLLVDKSSSMEAHFPAVRAEVDRLLSSLQRVSRTSYVDLICYDSNARSALGGLQPLDDQVATALRRQATDLQAGGGTNLRSGLELAGREVASHEHETTLIVLTDGEDGSLGEMLESMPEVRKLFGGVQVVAHTLTPRLFGGQGDPQPQSQPEQRLSRLAEELRGHFGPVREDG